MKNWKINSWRKFPVKHIPEYPDKKELDQVLDKIKTFPPLVFAGETRHLKQQLAEVVDGEAFLLQGGDCAESFAESHPDNIRDSLFLLEKLDISNNNLQKLLMEKHFCYKEVTALKVLQNSIRII